MLDKRIGELQLRVEQISGLEAEIKRLNDKLKASEEGSKAMEDEIDILIKKKAAAEEEAKKWREALQTEVAQGQQKTVSRASSIHTLSLNSVPVKNILKENSALRNAHIKDKVAKLKFSEIMQFNSQAPADPFKNLRKQALASLVQSKIYSPE